MAEYGLWAYDTLFKLPPEKGARILRLLERNISHGTHGLGELLTETKKWGGGQG